MRRRISRHGSDHAGWKGDEVSYGGLHQWLRRNFPKTGACVDCGREGRTEWASLDGSYRRVREAWVELCRSCHCKRDGLIENITRHV